MTKEELRKEAEEWLSITDNHLNDERTHFLSESEYAEQAYLAGAEPREKRIAELKAEVKEWKDKADLWCKTANLKDHNIMINKELEKENAELRKRVNELEEMYEKSK